MATVRILAASLLVNRFHQQQTIIAIGPYNWASSLIVAVHRQPRQLVAAKTQPRLSLQPRTSGLFEATISTDTDSLSELFADINNC